MEYPLQFEVSLIKVAPAQSAKASQSIIDNCTHVDGLYHIFEGYEDVLKDDGVVFSVVGGGIVGCLGDLSKDQLIDLCRDELGVDIKKEQKGDSK